MDWIKNNIVYLTKAGSQAYGLATDLSDLDLKGVCIPPRHVENNLFQRFDQAENLPFLNDTYGSFKNPKNPKLESTVYSLRKFFILAANVNPNIIELLWTDPSDYLVIEPVFREMINRRTLFISTKAKFTFSGYACSQLAKIERHRKWIVQGELAVPKREDFGLPPVMARGTEEVFGYIKAKVEQWNFNQFPLEESSRADMKELIWELVYELTQKEVSWDNWPDAYAEAAVHKMAQEMNLSDSVVRLINAERQYFKAKKNYESWLKWKAERNPARRALEVKSGYDTKHASHLVRLMRMGHEIMTEGKVIVKRPDAEELLDIKNGGWSYERVMEHAAELQKRLDGIYKQIESDRKAGKPVVLPKEVNYEELNALYRNLSEDYLSQKEG